MAVLDAACAASGTHGWPHGAAPCPAAPCRRLCRAQGTHAGTAAARGQDAAIVRRAQGLWVRGPAWWLGGLAAALLPHGRCSSRRRVPGAARSAGSTMWRTAVWYDVVARHPCCCSNTSCSTTWYNFAYHETALGIKRGETLMQASRLLGPGTATVASLQQQCEQIKAGQAGELAGDPATLTCSLSDPGRARLLSWRGTRQPSVIPAWLAAARRGAGGHGRRHEGGHQRVARPARQQVRPPRLEAQVRALLRARVQGRRPARAA